MSTIALTDFDIQGWSVSKLTPQLQINSPNLAGLRQHPNGLLWNELILRRQRLFAFSTWAVVEDYHFTRFRKTVADRVTWLKMADWVEL